MTQKDSSLTVQNGAADQLDKDVQAAVGGDGVNGQPILVLLAEDNPADVRLLREHLSHETGLEFALVHAERMSDVLLRLGTDAFDVVLLDLQLPDSAGLETVRRARAACTTTAIVVLTGIDDADLALEAVRNGAQDYLVKGKVDGQVLARVIRYAIERKRGEEERERLIGELQLALASVKRLSGLLPICAGCKKIRNDAGYWEQIEEYINEHSEARFTHSYCPECLRRFYPELFGGGLPDDEPPDSSSQPAVKV